ncbi:MAG: LysR family transcriptional regulator [Hoeflea sp.]|uniref:LysR family transcriptional regulator n=1 Tax=Hoeflea sp. TaxID=1940281 RepID=UPI002732027F|nr:LysR family transcriptional regulator [Hoeflea sp.]MDP2121693.1 LysR family transcriptional regulator [Hoeflea sp.]MDP3525076.1 LysR family transcriptional regulator [Hoeflea sp.]MDZ7600429.1 LysR family transcriptional regulator [Hoeflea sp.]
MQNTLDLRLLRTFVCAARSRSLSATAVQVLRTQSAVTMQIQRLEETLGQTLFHRSGSGIRPTESGERFLAYAERILRTHDEAISEFAEKRLYGSISLGCPEDYLIAFGPTLLQSFGAINSAVEITVVSAPTNELRKLLQQKQIDLALVSTPKPTDADVILRHERLVFVGNRPNLALQDFGDALPLALSASNTMDHRAACDAMEKAGIKYRISFASNSLAGLIAIARSGLAISVFTQNAVPPDLHVQDKFLPRLAHIGVLVAYADQEQSAVVKAFGEHIHRVLPQI